VEHTATEAVQNVHRCSRQHQRRIRTVWTKLDHTVIAAAFVSGVVVFQLVSERAMLITSIVFNSDNEFFAITAAFEASPPL